MKSVKPAVPFRLTIGDRFETRSHVVSDRLTGLMWLRSALRPEDVVDWPSALETISLMNTKALYGYDNWCLPNIRELESLVALDQHSPALPATHPFKDVAQGYWSSTTSVYDPTYAWVLYIDDGNVGVGFKEKADFSVWPVRNGIS